MEPTLVFPFLLVLVSGAFSAESESPRVREPVPTLPRVYRVRSWRDRVVLRKFGIRAQKVIGVRLRSGGCVNGLAVSAVRPASAADRRGLPPGDILIALCGMPVRSGDHLRIVLGGAGLSQATTMTIVRREKIRALACGRIGQAQGTISDCRNRLDASANRAYVGRSWEIGSSRSRFGSPSCS